MARIIECVPNCSEGRNKEVIEYIADAVRSVPGVALMDYSLRRKPQPQRLYHRRRPRPDGRGGLPLCQSLR